MSCCARLRLGARAGQRFRYHLRVDIRVPASLRRVIEALAARGGRPFIVGGAVRDALLGLPAKDLDIEVFGLPADVVREVLATSGTVNAVGEAFTVFKLSGLEGVEGAVDVSLPRRDSKAGPVHRKLGFEVAVLVRGAHPMQDAR